MIMPQKRRINLKIEECWLYAIASPSDLARRLSTPKHKVSLDELHKLAKDAENFRLFSITGDSGKPRPIQEPKRRLQIIHGRIHTLLARIEAPAYLHSAVRGRSHISNAAAHDPAMPTIKIDVKKFFPSVSRVSIFNFFAEQLKCRRDVAGLVADILTFNFHLPTGGAASQIIAYYAFKAMFDEIFALSIERGLKMSCYVDDITLSGLSANSSVLFKIRNIIASHGLKSHKAYVFAASQPKIVTGVCNTPPGPRVPNKLHLKIKAGFDQLSLQSTLEARAKVLGPLIGRLEAAGQIDSAFRTRAIALRKMR